MGAGDSGAVGAVIFDMDGVIVDSEPYSMQAFVDELRHHGIEPTGDEIRHSYGRKVEEDFRELFARYGVTADLRAAVVSKRERYFRLARGNLQPFPGTRALLDRVRAKGYRVGLASSGDREKVALSVRSLALEGVFESVVTGDDIARSKPHPEIYRLAAARIGVEPGRCVAIEDAPNGVRAAKAAGMRCIAVTNSVTRAELVEADLIVASLADDLSPVLPL